jgi:HEAT repeat protein
MLGRLYWKISRVAAMGICCAMIGGCATTGISNSKISIAPAEQIILRGLHSASPAIRSAAVESASQLPRQSAVTALKEALRDRASAVRFTACIVIGNLRLRNFRSELLALYPASGQRVKAGIIYALARIGDQQYVGQLAILLHAKDPTVRANAAMVLGRLGDPTAIGLLRTDSGDPIHAVRLAVTSALARLGYHRAISSIIALSYSRYAIDHLAALNTSRSLNTPLAANVLLNGLHDPLPAGRLIAARGLGQRGSEQGEEIARHYAGSSDSSYRVLAALALGWIPDGNNAHRLVHMLHDPSEKVRIAAAAGLLHLYYLAKLGQEYSSSALH